MVVQQHELEEGRREVAPLAPAVPAPVDAAVIEADPGVVLGDEDPVLVDRIDRDRFPDLCRNEQSWFALMLTCPLPTSSD